MVVVLVHDLMRRSISRSKGGVGDGAILFWPAMMTNA